MAERTFLSLTEVAEVEQVLLQSQTAPVMVFLHDRGCPISGYAWRQMQHLPETIGCAVWLVDVTRAHAVSRAIEAQTGVWHESPQVVLLRNGVVVWDAAHFDITTDAVTEAVERQS